MWTLVVVGLCVIGLALIALRMKRKRDLPIETFVCDVCGRKHCDCRKEGP